MAKHNAANERVKHDYFEFLTGAKGRDEATIDRIAKSLARFEELTGRKEFKTFHRQQALAFKRRLGDAVSARTRERLSKATVHAALRDVKSFFEWLAREPGFRKHISFADSDYLSPNEKDAAIARATRDKLVPSLDQVEAAMAAMPSATALERRDRALVSFTAITGARVNALRTFQVRHVNIENGFVEQDARDVGTKFAKTFRTDFMPVSEAAIGHVQAWLRELKEDHLWGPTDPLFPAPMMGLDESGLFRPVGIIRQGWATTAPIRDAFKRAFAAADLPYFNPHSFRDMLVLHAMRQNFGPEQMKAWSQNLGHDEVLTTFTSYGRVPTHRQAELIKAAGLNKRADLLDDPDVLELLERIARKAA